MLLHGLRRSPPKLAVKVLKAPDHGEVILRALMHGSCSLASGGLPARIHLDMICRQALETRWAEQVREVTRQAEEEQEATHDKVFELQR